MNEVFVAYQPFGDEPLYTDLSFPFAISEIFILPRDKESDPFAWAETCKDLYKDRIVNILVPGRSFDIYGTRHGRGFGWYDRFLANVPRSWRRIGVAHVSQFSTRAIVRKPLDEPVDIVVIRDGLGWKVHKI